jgi:hypothetical protein
MLGGVSMIGKNVNVGFKVANYPLEEQIGPLLYSAHLNESKVNEWLTSSNVEFMGYAPLHVIQNGGAGLVVGYLKRKLGIS